MSDKPYGTLVFIGRFSPLHKGHEAVISEALKQADKVVVLIGSSFEARNIRNPWTYEERQEMVRLAFPYEFGIEVETMPLSDFPYDDTKWIAEVQKLVSDHVYADKKVGLIGHNKDHTSYYLKMFPDWGSVAVKNYKNLNATDIRENLFNSIDPKFDTMTAAVLDYAYDTMTKGLVSEYHMIKTYKKSWEAAPYAPIFQTVDAVVVQSGHILLVKRKASPGKGLWALPGGFLNPEERLLDGMIRELREETKIKVPVPVLKGSIKASKVFDAPHRSTRGRTITNAYHIELENDNKLPKVTGADDAEKAKWVKLSELDMEMFFEDHFHIIDYFCNIG